MSKKEALILIAWVAMGCSSIEDSSLSNQWKNDKYGCMQFRSIETAKRLIKQNDLMNKSIDEVTSIFGASEDNIPFDKNHLTYYLNSTCEKGKVVDESDKCWLTLSFDSGKLVTVDFPCE